MIKENEDNICCDNVISFYIPGVPMSKLRPRFGMHGNVRTPEKTVNYESYVKSLYAYLNKGVYFGEKPIDITIEAYFSIPKSYSKKKKQLISESKLFPTKKPDADNIIKVICDALNGVAYHDDKQIVSCKCRKLYTFTEPYVSVTIQEAR